MKRVLLFLIFISLFLPLPKTFAHGGIQDSTDNITVTFFNDPFSPVIGKNVLFTAIFTDKESGTRLDDYSGILTIKETVYGEEGKDKTLLSKNVKSDENGTVNFNYTFQKGKIYDIEIKFPQIKEAENSVGYLIEPRAEISSQKGTSLYIVGITFMVLGLILGFLVSKRFLNPQK